MLIPTGSAFFNPLCRFMAALLCLHDPQKKHLLLKVLSVWDQQQRALCDSSHADRSVRHRPHSSFSPTQKGREGIYVRHTKRAGASEWRRHFFCALNHLMCRHAAKAVPHTEQKPNAVAFRMPAAQHSPPLETCGCNPRFSLTLQTVSVSGETPRPATLQHAC